MAEQLTRAMFKPIVRKPIAIVHLEGTIAAKTELSQDIGQPIPGVKEKMLALEKTHSITIVSKHARTKVGANRVRGFLKLHGIPYFDICKVTATRTRRDVSIMMRGNYEKQTVSLRLRSKVQAVLREGTIRPAPVPICRRARSRRIA